jgi:hypothetical protein
MVVINIIEAGLSHLTRIPALPLCPGSRLHFVLVALRIRVLVEPYLHRGIGTRGALAPCTGTG